jgi:hypothetical protein
MLCLSYYANIFCSNKMIRAEQDLLGTEGGRGGGCGRGQSGEMIQTMYAHVNK